MGSAVCAASKTPILMKQLCLDLGQFSVGKKMSTNCLNCLCLPFSLSEIVCLTLHSVDSFHLPHFLETLTSILDVEDSVFPKKAPKAAAKTAAKGKEKVDNGDATLVCHIPRLGMQSFPRKCVLFHF